VDGGGADSSYDTNVAQGHVALGQASFDACLDDVGGCAHVLDASLEPPLLPFLGGMKIVLSGVATTATHIATHIAKNTEQHTAAKVELLPPPQHLQHP